MEFKVCRDGDSLVVALASDARAFCVFIPGLVAGEDRVAFQRASQSPRVDPRHFGDSQTAETTAM